MRVCEPVFPRLMQAGVLFFRWWLRRFEFQPARVAVEGRSTVVRNTHAARLQTSPAATILAYCTRRQSACIWRWRVSAAHYFDSFSIFLLSLKQQQNLMKVMFSCVHFPIIMIFNFFYTGTDWTIYHYAGAVGTRFSASWPKRFTVNVSKHGA